MFPLTEVTRIVIGISLLLYGRRLFWFFLGALGFVVGLEYGTVFFAGASAGAQLAAALCFGVLSAFLAAVVSRAVLALAGFVAGGYLVLRAVSGWAVTGWVAALIAAAAGILSAVAMLVSFSWALVALSSLLGAALIVGGVSLGAGLESFLVTVLAVTGVYAQTRQRRPDKRD